jgi:polysaccharide export outer membrane protein
MDKMNRTLIKFFIISLSLLAASCSPYKQVPYFQDLDRSTVITEEIKNFSPLTIQQGDILGISVTSNSDPSAVAVFNYNLNRVSGVNTDYTPSNAVVGYLVDNKGNIQVPYLGTIKVEGYTTIDLRDILTKALVKYVNLPVVNIRILNFKVAVMGDVLKPDVYSFSNEKVTIVQALAAAGDLTITAKRKTVLLIREVDGRRQFIPIDLTSKKVFESPYFYLKNNDVIYADPDRTKYAPLDEGYKTAQLVIEALSASALVITVILYKK